MSRYWEEAGWTSSRKDEVSLN